MRGNWRAFLSQRASGQFIEHHGGRFDPAVTDRLPSAPVPATYQGTWDMLRTAVRQAITARSDNLALSVCPIQSPGRS